MGMLSLEKRRLSRDIIIVILQGPNEKDEYYVTVVEHLFRVGQGSFVKSCYF